MHFSESDWIACCGSSKFAKEMAKVGPFKNLAEAIEMSRQIWWNQVDVPGWLEAFGAHPRIGALSSKSTTDWCAEEQATALSSANDRALKDLAEWNRLYESKFGFVFLVCATGKSSSEILQLLKGRITNRPLVELQVAANEQQKITELRLSKLVSQNTAPGGDENTSKLSLSEQRLDHEKPLGSPLSREESGTFRTGNIDFCFFVSLRVSYHILLTKLAVPVPIGDAKADGRLSKIEAHVSGQQPQPSLRPPITTHVLDVSLGRPAAGLEISLERLEDTSWMPLGTSVTNQDGRSGPLMQASERVAAGVYRLTFNTGKYLSSTASSAGAGPFYPYVCIIFDIKPPQEFQHFHVPLLLSPFSFTTYRGS
ncbi:uric acid degradation bifunctional protein TTL isoform X2 [Selaginella moellendorffii]|uniref:uric acid degradation bifunctional protein TTL isoform X2 n=1 Tax=Selaginella moellendorffii TaxID=88036 RepID=UPI000D1C6622|nr:uric acid degradation bifunctional protein TTL isoform X2 [Selaginella moellendorffii]|eukprot:XP_024530574.1 uric acid degradation bifunctional protein TTL isoform X2 [Selaginella moellendorffii]